MRLAALAALVRAAFLTATSYRLRFVQSILTSVVSVVPVFFVARALQPMMGPTIHNEGSDFFAFLVVGFVVMSFVVTCVDTLPTQVGSDIKTASSRRCSAPRRDPVDPRWDGLYLILFTMVAGS